MSKILSLSTAPFRGLWTLAGLVRNSEDDLRAVYGRHPNGQPDGPYGTRQGAIVGLLVP